MRLVKGSHIVVPRLFDHDRAYILQSADRRVVFVLPFEHDFTLIGTTNENFAGDPAAAAPSPDEINYLCDTVNLYFRDQIRAVDVKWAFAGVRSLYDEGARKPEDASRDYHFTLDERSNEAPVVTIYGGKITTYRRLAEAVLARLAHVFPQKPPWTATAPLPGGDFPHDSIGALVAEAAQMWPFLSDRHAQRLVRAYGTRIHQVIGAAMKLDDLGTRFGADLTEAEIRYLIRHEWARTDEDVLWRRSKLGMHLLPAEREAVARFVADAVAKTSSNQMQSSPP
jgi:glycerol-3-phosphate dehydrogenase